MRFWNISQILGEQEPPKDEAFRPAVRWHERYLQEDVVPGFDGMGQPPPLITGLMDNAVPLDAQGLAMIPDTEQRAKAIKALLNSPDVKSIRRNGYVKGQ